jgi:hypothetical protein
VDSSSFDRWSRLLAGELTRRRALAALVALAGSTGIASAGPAPAGARTVCRAVGASCTRGSQCCQGACATGRNVPRARRNRCICPGDLTACKGACVDTSSDGMHCGACGNVCGSEQICRNGACVYTCEDSTTYSCFVSVDGYKVQYENGVCGNFEFGIPCTADAECATALAAPGYLPEKICFSEFKMVDASFVPPFVDYQVNPGTGGWCAAYDRTLAGCT